MLLQRIRQIGLLLFALAALCGHLTGGAFTAASAHEGPSASVQPPAAAGGLQREVFGFALSSSLSDPTVGYPTWNFSLLSTVAYFGLHVNDDGTFASDSDMSVWNSSQLTNLVSAAHSHGARVVLTIVLQDFSSGTPHMCSGLYNGATTVTNTVNQVNAKGVDGVNVDYEGLNGSCGSPNPSYARGAMVTFTHNLRAALPAGSYLSIDTYASSASDPVGFYDIAGLSPYVDSFFVMAYDLEYSNYSRPPTSCSSFCLGPTAPLGSYYYNDSSTASQYLAVTPASKVLLGVPYYGRKACVGGAVPNAYPTSGVTADTYLDASTESSSSMVQAGSYATHRDANDQGGQERWDTWYNTSLKCTRELYWDDTVSLNQKYKLINSDGLRGVGIWNLNYGGGAPELWSALASSFSMIPSAPGNVTACAGTDQAMVSWSPAASSGGPITSYQVMASPGGATVTVPGSATFAAVQGLTPGAAYTLTVQAVNAAGPGVGATSAAVTPVAQEAADNNYFNWFDRRSPGMVSDNIHVSNPGSAASAGCVFVPGQAVVPYSVAAGQETYVTLPALTGGPVVVSVNTGAAVLASQRVEFGQSFNEAWARMPNQAATTSYINWFDKASPGMLNDNLHVMNPSAATANVTVSLPGATALHLSVAPGGEAYTTFPQGTIGGPVKITSDQPVLAAQRVQFDQSFNEVWAQSPAVAATASYINWFDKASPGMVNDNIHIVNPNGTAANVTVKLGTGSQHVAVAAGGEAIVTFAPGNIGGPLTITSDQPVLASQRVQFDQSFNEVSARSAAQGITTSYFNWFDKASPGMVSDNIHAVNPGTTAATVTLTLPGASPVKFTVGPGMEAFASFPTGTIGGPLTVSSTQPILVSERVDYVASFNEIWGSG